MNEIFVFEKSKTLKMKTKRSASYFLEMITGLFIGKFGVTWGRETESLFTNSEKVSFEIFSTLSKYRLCKHQELTNQFY